MELLALWRSGNDFTAQLRVGRQHTVETDQMETRARHQSRQALHELQRLHEDMGGAVFVRTFQLQYDLAGAVTLEPFVGDGRPGNVAAELLQFQTLIGAPAHRRMEAKAVRVDTQLWGGRHGSARQALQAQHFLPSAWAQRNTISARFRELAPLWFFDENPQARQCAHGTRGDLGE